MRVRAKQIALRIVFFMRHVIQRGTVRHPEFMSKAFTRRMLAHLTQIATIFVDQPHTGVNRIARSFVTKRDGIVVERAINGVP
ncbi:hypothetical protein D3C80_1217320 [compost metagenome]